MKKGIVFLCTLLMTMLFAVTPLAGSADEETVTINVYNWGQYMALGEEGAIHVNEEFTKRTGIKVNYSIYDSNEVMYTKLKTGGANYDVIIPSDYMIERMIKEDMLEELNFDNIPNFQYIDEGFVNPVYDPENKYSVPYTYGTVGLIYNTKYVTETPDSWAALWDEQYKGKILMFDNPRDAFGIAQALLGYDLNTTDENELKACQEKLKEQKPLVQGYVMDQVFQLMENEDAWLAPYYAGDYLTMYENNPDLGFVLPKEGFNKFVDAICIPKGAAHKEAAEAYINFLCDPEIAGQNMDAIGYSTPISAAKEYMSEEYANSPIAYPDAETLERGEIFTNLPDETLQLMDSLWSGMKVGQRSVLLYVLIAAGVVVLVALVVIVRVVKKRRNDPDRDE